MRRLFIHVYHSGEDIAPAYLLFHKDNGFGEKGFDLCFLSACKELRAGSNERVHKHGAVLACAADEYKIQVIVPGQERGARSQFDYSDGRLGLLAAYVRMSEAVDSGVFVLWDASKHQEFSYSANVQVKTETIIEALCIPVAEGIRNNNEIILAAQQKHLLAAIKRRVEIMGREVREEKRWD